MRYFLEVSYKGTNYSGFQIQQNANTIQSEIEKALSVLLKQNINLTGSSRTDAGVHALQNFFHFDTETILVSGEKFDLAEFKGDTNKQRFLYNLNSILPTDIVCKNIIPVTNESHCRFDAIRREYKYYIYRYKNPFINDRGYYYPYSIDFEKLNEAASLIKDYSDFSSFSKSNTQVKTFECKIFQSEWIFENGTLIYHVEANRFLRGMVRALTATMLKIGRGKLSVNDLKTLIEVKSFGKASFAVPSHGLFLVSVHYPAEYFNQ